MVWLSSRGEFDDLHCEDRREGSRSRRRSGFPRFIGVKHEDDFIEVGSDQVGLAVGELRAHEGRHVVMPGLMDFESIEEAFDKNEGAVALPDGSMEIEQQVRFTEAGREAIFGLCLAGCATRVRDEFAMFVMDWNHDSSAKETVPVVVANAEVAGRLLTESTRCHIGMLVVDVAQGEG